MPTAPTWSACTTGTPSSARRSPIASTPASTTTSTRCSMPAPCDAVIVCSETDRHRELVETAARRGLPVLCEKPIATTLEDAEAMIGVCDEHRVQLHVAFVTRFYPVVQQVRAAIAAGSIGDVVAMVGGNRGRPPLPPSYPAGSPTRSDPVAARSSTTRCTSPTSCAISPAARSSRVSAEVDDRFWASGVDDMAPLSVVFDNGAIAADRSELVGPRRQPVGLRLLPARPRQQRRDLDRRHR